MPQTIARPAGRTPDPLLLPAARALLGDGVTPETITSLGERCPDEARFFDVLAATMEALALSESEGCAAILAASPPGPVR